MSLKGENEKFRKRRAGETDNIQTHIEYLTIHVNDQMFGIPVLQVQDVLREQRMTRVPLAPPEVAGALNLRGRIVTAINVRRRLGLPDLAQSGPTMSVVVEHENELFSLIIDRVGDVLSLPSAEFEGTPATMDPVWREIATGIFRLENQLLVIIDVPRLLQHTIH